MHFVKFTAEEVASKAKPKSKRVNYMGNPILNGVFISENVYVGSGFDQVPLIFKTTDGENWTFEGSLDPGYGKVKESKINTDAFGGKTAFFDGFELSQDLSMKPKDTIHQNYINYTQPYVTGGDGKVMVLSTSDPNGSINYWDCSKL